MEKLINQSNQKCFTLNSPKEISTLTDLVHPTKQIFTQNIFQPKENISCTFPKNPVLRLPERTIQLATWITQPKKSPPFLKKLFSQRKKSPSGPVWKNQFSIKWKFLIFSLRISMVVWKRQVFQTKIVPYNYLKKAIFIQIIIKHFFSCCNTFLYTQLAFVFHLLGAFYMVYSRINAFFFFFFFGKTLISFTHFFCSLSLLSRYCLADEFLGIFIYVKKNL